MVTGGDSDAAIVLIGAPGNGKSTVGALLADRLGREFVDTDRVVEQLEGREIGEIFIDSGEARFREIEQRAAAQVLQRRGTVVALGSGAVLDERTRGALHDATVVFLQVGLKDASRRAGFDQGAALLALNPRGRWLRLLEGRRPVYEALATHRVDTDGRTAHEVTDEVAKRLAGMQA